MGGDGRECQIIFPYGSVSPRARQDFSCAFVADWPGCGCRFPGFLLNLGKRKRDEVNRCTGRAKNADRLRSGAGREKPAPSRFLFGGESVNAWHQLIASM